MRAPLGSSCSGQQFSNSSSSSSRKRQQLTDCLSVCSVLLPCLARLAEWPVNLQAALNLFKTCNICSPQQQQRRGRFGEARENLTTSRIFESPFLPSSSRVEWSWSRAKKGGSQSITSRSPSREPSERERREWNGRSCWLSYRLEIIDSRVRNWGFALAPLWESLKC